MKPQGIGGVSFSPAEAADAYTLLHTLDGKLAMVKTSRDPKFTALLDQAIVATRDAGINGMNGKERLFIGDQDTATFVVNAMRRAADILPDPDGITGLPARAEASVAEYDRANRA